MYIPGRKMKPIKSHTPDLKKTKNSFSINLSPDQELRRTNNPHPFYTTRILRSPREGENSLLVNKTRGLQSKYQFKLKILTHGQKPSPEKAKLQKSVEGDRTYSEEDANERFVRYIAGYPKISKEKSFSRPSIGYLVDYPNICEFNSVVNTLKAKKDPNLFYSFAKDSSVKALKIDGHAKVNPNLLKFNPVLANNQFKDFSDSTLPSSRSNLPSERSRLEALKYGDTSRPYGLFNIKDRSRSENILIPPLKIDSTKIDLKISIAAKLDGSSSSSRERLKPIRPSRTRPLRKPESVKLSVMFDKQQ